jgi:hypothetical protein
LVVIVSLKPGWLAWTSWANDAAALAEVRAAGQGGYGVVGPSPAEGLELQAARQSNPLGPASDG